MSGHLRTPSGRPRARSFGIPLIGEPGAANAITDVPGVEVGYTTLVAGEGARTGVTAILPRGRGGIVDGCAAGAAVLNGNGEMTGTAWIEECGILSLPVTITNTHAVGVAHAATISWAVDHDPSLADLWLLPVVAETWDGYLNEINAGHVTAGAVRAAIAAAADGPVDEGCVGGGTGMNCYGFKGGTGTASRRVAIGEHRYTVGALLQCNFGARHELVIAGVPVGAALTDDNPMDDVASWFGPPGAGSVIAIIATDAPLLPGQCKALARRVPLGLARTGTTGSHYSGDLFLAFSTANPGGFTTARDGFLSGAGRMDTLRFLPWGAIDDLFSAVAYAVEECVLNALFAATAMTGRRGHRSPAMPHAPVVDLLRARGVTDRP